MNNVSLCVNDVCDDCPTFKPSYYHLKRCAEGKGAIINLIKIKCANSDLCAYIRTFIKKIRRMINN